MYSSAQHNLTHPSRSHAIALRDKVRSLATPGSPTETLCVSRLQKPNKTWAIQPSKKFDVGLMWHSAHSAKIAKNALFQSVSESSIIFVRLRQKSAFWISFGLDRLACHEASPALPAATRPGEYGVPHMYSATVHAVLQSSLTDRCRLKY